MSITKLVILGTGTPSLQTNRYQSSAALIVNDQPYIVDCGSGSLQRQMDARAMGMTAFDFPKLTRLFITHLHPDHTLGIPAFIISNWVKGRTETLQIYGPKGIAKIAKGTLDMFAEGIEEHKQSGSNPLGEIALEVIEHEDGIIYTDERVSVEAFRVDHGGLETYGLKFVTPDKVVVFSADTCALPIMAEMAKGCDMLVHSAYCQAGLKKLPPSWDHYFATMHTSGKALGAIANQAQPKLLVLTHQIMFNGMEPADLIKEVREGGFTGKVVYANDMDVFE
ncbi:MAG: ribonuclease BN (tRNA processing enzyme) [Cellvibrionaceae bacterium]|jgi:ribonuclease BN (tRNA processing enzyme)